MVYRSLKPKPDVAPLTTYHFHGTPEQLGHAHGETLRDRIQSFVHARLDTAVQYCQAQGIDDEAVHTKLRQTGQACWQALKSWDSDGFAEHNAIAEAAGVDAADLYTATNYTDVRDAFMLAGAKPDQEGCSALMVPPHLTATHQVLAGQTWDLEPAALDYVVAIHRQPQHGPAQWSIQVVGALSLMGMNSAGLSVGTTNLKTYGSRIGIGYTDLIYRALRCTTLDAAGALLATAPLAGAHSYWLADQHQGVRYEVTGQGYTVQRLTRQPMAWTNHCLDPSHQAYEYLPPSSSSLARQQRMYQLLDSEQEVAIQTIKTIFSDRTDGINSISRHFKDQQGTTTNACMIVEPRQRQVHACRGPADRKLWQVLTLD